MTGVGPDAEVALPGAGAEAAEEGQLPPDTAARLDALLDRIDTPSPDDDEDDD